MERLPCWERSPTSRLSLMTSPCSQLILTNYPQRVNRLVYKTVFKKVKFKSHQILNKELCFTKAISLRQVITDLKGSDYSWSYQTPPSSPSSSGSRKSSMCRFSLSCTLTDGRLLFVIKRCLSVRKRSLLRLCQSLSVIPSLLFVQSPSGHGISK